MLEDDGWYLVVAVGSYRQYKHPTKIGRVTAPGKLGGDLPIGTNCCVTSGPRGRTSTSSEALV
ncbi:MAG: type II toxin-antitoxin system HicA family toxin [Pseudonocardia sp.]|nr:type II toxin-antitoxin system HicA family toxin [Pseudonocardia sp.]